MRRCRLNGSDAQPWQGSLSDRILIAENRCAALFVSTCTGTEKQVVLQCGRPVSTVPLLDNTRAVGVPRVPPSEARYASPAGLLGALSAL
jgi:hypothetical protein